LSSSSAENGLEQLLPLLQTHVGQLEPKTSAAAVGPDSSLTATSIGNGPNPRAGTGNVSLPEGFQKSA
jgi:hypothetical protein